MHRKLNIIFKFYALSVKMKIESDISSTQPISTSNSFHPTDHLIVFSDFKKKIIYLILKEILKIYPKMHN